MSELNHAGADVETEKEKLESAPGERIEDPFDEWLDLARAQSIRSNLEDDQSRTVETTWNPEYDDQTDQEFDVTNRLVSQIASAVPRWRAEVEQEELDAETGCRRPSPQDYEALDRLPTLGGAGVRQLLRVLLDLLISSDSIVRSMISVSDRPVLSKTTDVPRSWHRSRRERRRGLALVAVNSDGTPISGALDPSQDPNRTCEDVVDVLEVDLGPHSASKEVRVRSPEGRDDLVFSVHVVWRVTDPHEVVRRGLDSIWTVVLEELDRFVSRVEPNTPRPQFIAGLQSRLNNETSWGSCGLEAAVHVLHLDSGDRGPVNQVAFEELKHAETEFLRRFIADIVQSAKCSHSERSNTPLITTGISDAEAYLTCEVLLGEKNMYNVAPFAAPQYCSCGGGV
jgi:hypothetical protein